MIADVNKLVSGAATVSQGTRPSAAPFLGSSATGGPAFQAEAPEPASSAPRPKGVEGVGVTNTRKGG
jgi:hypothetical protein